MSKTEGVFVPCEAGCHVVGLKVDWDQEEPAWRLAYLSMYVGSFYGGQESIGSRWRRRLAAIVTILRGRDWLFEDVVISEASARILASELTPRPEEDVGEESRTRPSAASTGLGK